MPPTAATANLEPASLHDTAATAVPVAFLHQQQQQQEEEEEEKQQGSPEHQGTSEAVVQTSCSLAKVAQTQPSSTGQVPALALGRPRDKWWLWRVLLEDDLLLCDMGGA